MDVQYDFDDPSWDDVSEDAKDLIRALLVKEPTQRLTAKQVLEHSWVKVCAFSVVERISSIIFERESLSPLNLLSFNLCKFVCSML